MSHFFFHLGLRAYDIRQWTRCWVSKFSPNRIFTLNDHLWPVWRAADWITGSFQKVLANVFFFIIFAQKKKLLRYKMCGNIEHFTLLVVKRCHRGKDLRRRLTNPVNRKFQIVQKQEYFLHIIKCYLRAVRCPTLLWCDPNIVTRSGWKEKESRKT